VQSMRDGTLKSFELDSSGNKTDVTHERLADFESTISSLTQVIASIDEGPGKGD